MKKVRYLNWLLVICWMGVIFYLSHQPAASSRSLSEGVLSSLLNILPQEQGKEITLLHTLLRKSAHFIAYFILAILLCRAFFSTQMKRAAGISRFFFVWFICFLYAASDEIHQTFIPGRSGEFRDVIIDSLGSLLGLLLYSIFLYWWMHRKKKNIREEVSGK